MAKDKEKVKVISAFFPLFLLVRLPAGIQVPETNGKVLSKEYLVENKYLPCLQHGQGECEQLQAGQPHHDP